MNRRDALKLAGLAFALLLLASGALVAWNGDRRQPLSRLALPLSLLLWLGLMAVPPHAQVEQLLSACQRYETNELMVGGAS